MRKGAALLGLLLLFYLPALGSSATTHPDEKYYLGISAEMDARQAWLTPTLDGEPLWFKPPLLYWAERACYAVFGRTLFAGRLPAALAAIGLALLTGALARRMYGERAELPAALLVASCFGFLKFGRLAMMDAPMTLAFAAAAWGAWRASEEGRAPQLLWVGVGAGAAFMLKGPVGAVIVLLFAGGFLALRRPGLLASRWTAGAFGLGAAIGLPWYVASFAVHGWKFYDFLVRRQNFDRFEHGWTVQGELTLLLGFLVFLLPWTLLFLAALPGLRRVRQNPALLLPTLWIAAVLGVFTIPSLKWPHYGLSCIPAAVLLAVHAPLLRQVRLVTAGLLGILGLAAAVALRWRLPAGPALALALAAALLGLGAIALAKDHLAEAAARAGLAAALVLGWALPQVNPPALPEGPARAIAGRPLYLWKDTPGLLTMDARRPVHRLRDEAQLGEALRAGGVVILAESDLPAFRGPYPGLATVARWSCIPEDLAPGRVWRSWVSRDPALLLDPVLAVAAPQAGPAAR